ncbi:MAG: hypothetical protein IJ587_01415 [Synergistaceae bacterium]|nr:hypothetical protein [Synergistaceae bacterium]
MCGDENAARSLIEDIKDKGNEKLKDWIEKGFKKLVLKFFPNGQKFLDDAKKINDVRKKREEELSKAIAAYNSAKSAMDAQKADEKITYVWGQFKTAYNKLKEIHIYEGSNSIKFPNLND